MSIEQDIYDFYDPSEITVLRTFLEQGTLTIDDVVILQPFQVSSSCRYLVLQLSRGLIASQLVTLMTCCCSL